MRYLLDLTKILKIEKHFYKGTRTVLNGDILKASPLESGRRKDYTNYSFFLVNIILKQVKQNVKNLKEEGKLYSRRL